MVKRLAIIPARSGSKRIKDKNIRDFCGKPIISYILQTAKTSNLFDKIHVSTNDKNIKKIVENLGFNCHFPRPKYLSTDFAPLMPVLKFVVKKFRVLGEEFDQIWLLMACSPLVTSKQLQEAKNLYEKNKNKNSLTTISEYPVPIDWALKMRDDKVLYPERPKMFAKRSQDIEKKYFDTGSFSIFSSEIVLNSKGADPNTIFIGYEISKGLSIDIDDEDDWKLAEVLYRHRLKDNLS